MPNWISNLRLILEFYTNVLLLIVSYHRYNYPCSIKTALANVVSFLYKNFQRLKARPSITFKLTKPRLERGLVNVSICCIADYLTIITLYVRFALAPFKRKKYIPDGKLPLLKLNV